MTGIDVFMTFLIFLIDDPRLALISELYVVLATIFMQSSSENHAFFHQVKFNSYLFISDIKDGAYLRLSW